MSPCLVTIKSETFADPFALLFVAGWGAIFYLITTDILGWAQTAYVFSNTGYGLGVGIFVLMGLAAGASGIM